MNAPPGWAWLAKRLARGRAPDPASDADLVVQIDGAIGAAGIATGLGVVVRGADGTVRSVHKRRLGPMTNNEAEYSALILALETVTPLDPPAVRIVSDSEIVVYQMQGRFSVNSPALKALHRQACALARRIPNIHFTHVPRELNALADALAREALWPDAPWADGARLDASRSDEPLSNATRSDGPRSDGPRSGAPRSAESRGTAGGSRPASASAPGRRAHVRGHQLRRRR